MSLWWLAHLRSSDVCRKVTDYWWAVVLLVVSTLLLAYYFIQGYDVAFSVAALVTTDPFFLSVPWLNGTSALFQHGGWYMTQGAIPYVDIWDVKPPLIYYLTALLAFISGGNMNLLHLLSGLTSAAAIVATIVLVATIVHRITDEDVAALAAGGVMLTLPYLYRYPIHGIRPKYFTLAFGAFALLLALRERFGPAGASAAIAAGFWQFGAIFFILVAGMAFRSDGQTLTHERIRTRALVRTVAAGGGIAALTIVPFLLWGAFVPLIVEAVLVSFVAPTPATVLGRIYNTVDALGYATILLPFAIIGWVRGASFSSGHFKVQWWILCGGVLFGVQVLFFDGEGWPDIMTLLLFVALGVGVVAASQPRVRQWILVGFLAFLIVAGPVWADSASAPLKPGFDTVQQHYPAQQSEAVDTAIEEGKPSMQEIYWQQIKPESCHYYFGGIEVSWMKRTSVSMTDQQCGQWPAIG